MKKRVVVYIFVFLIVLIAVNALMITPDDGNKEPGAVLAPDFTNMNEKLGDNKYVDIPGADGYKVQGEGASFSPDGTINSEKDLTITDANNKQLDSEKVLR